MAFREMKTSRSLAEDDDDGDEGAIEYDTAGAFRELFSKKIALLLLFVPAAFAMHYVTVSCQDGEEVCKENYAVYNFVLNFGAIVPLAWLISEATEQLEPLVGDAWAVLLNSTFGNAVEMILSVSAIEKGLVKVVQASLLGAMLMNLLFVTGCCFVAFGYRRKLTTFNHNRAAYALALLAVAMMGLVVPTELAATDEWSTPEVRMNLSLAVSIMLFIMYAQWLYFNIHSHKSLFESVQHNHQQLERGALLALGDEEEVEDEGQNEEGGPQMHGLAATALLLAATIIVSFQCDWLVESIDPVTARVHMRKAFVATILLPMVGNFSEEIAALSIAMKGKVDLAMGVAIGSATQIALLVIPLAVFISRGTAQNQDMYFDLDFEVLQVRLLLVAILVAALCLQDGKANWLKGTMLITAYLIIASAFMVLSDKEFASGGGFLFFANSTSQ